MPVGTFHGWPPPPETQASTPERSGKVKSSRDGGVRKLLLSLALPGGCFVRAIPWFKQILKVFVCGLALHNGHNLKLLWAKHANQCPYPRLDVLERNLRSELNRQEKVGKTMVFHRLEQQSIRRSVKRLKAEIKTFKRVIRECVKSTPSLQQNFNLLHTIPGVGAKTAWIMIVILGSRAFRSAPEVASFLGLNPIEKRSGKSQYRRPRLRRRGFTAGPVDDTADQVSQNPMCSSASEYDTGTQAIRH